MAVFVRRMVVAEIQPEMHFLTPSLIFLCERITAWVSSKGRLTEGCVKRVMHPTSLCTTIPFLYPRNHFVLPTQDLAWYLRVGSSFVRKIENSRTAS